MTSEKGFHLAVKAVEELSETISRIDEREIVDVLGCLCSAKSIFVTGAGRTGLIMRCFAMRLMHLGLTVYVVGETTTPAAGPDDLLVVGSGSGSTSTSRTIAARAKEAGVKVVLATASPLSPLGSMVDVALTIPGATHSYSDVTSSTQPAGNGFEQALLVTLDAIVVALAEFTSEPFGRTLTRHVNLE